MLHQLEAGIKLKELHDGLLKTVEAEGNARQVVEGNKLLFCKCAEDFWGKLFHTGNQRFQLVRERPINHFFK